MADERLAYLRDWRQGLWAQIRQKEDAIWRFMTFYSAAVVLAAGLLQSDGATEGLFASMATAALATTVVLLVSFWGLAVVLDANFWLRRNLIFVGNIERELLPDEDIGKLVPAGYTQPLEFTYKGSYAMHGHLLCSVILLSVVALAWSALVNGARPSETDTIFLGLVFVVFSLGLLAIELTDRDRIRQFLKARDSAPGRDPKRRLFPRDVEIARFAWSSMLFGWQWVLTFAGGAAFVLIGHRAGVWPFDLGYMETLIAPILGLSAAIGLVVQWHAKSLVLPSCRTEAKALSNDHPRSEEDDRAYYTAVAALPCAKTLTSRYILVTRLRLGVLAVILFFWAVSVVRLAAENINA